MQARRTQILEDLGIDRWWLRRAATGHAAPGDRPVVDPPDQRPVAVPPAASPVLTDPGAEKTLPQMAEVSRANVAPAQPSGRTSAVDAWAALSLVAGGVVLLVDGSSSRRDLRLAMDVLATASGSWIDKPASRRFDWPPDGVSTIGRGADPAGRAFAAFVDKELADHGAETLLVEETLSERLPERGGPVRVQIPALARLGRDVAAKRALWEILRSIPG